MTDPITRTAPSAILPDTPIIAVLRAKDAANYSPAVDTLTESGIRSIELTLSTPNTIELLPGLIARTGPRVEIGIGTVTDVDQAQRAGHRRGRRLPGHPGREHGCHRSRDPEPAARLSWRAHPY